MNLTDLSAISPIVGKSFSSFLTDAGIDLDVPNFNVLPSYSDAELGNVVPVVMTFDDKTAGISLAEKASPSEYAALVDARAA